MDPAKIGRVEKLFHAARELPAEQRAAFLAQACPDDDEVRRRVLVMFTNEAALSTVPLGRKIDEALAEPEPLVEFEPGEQVGRYRIVRKLGEGGMGVVYAARQMDPVRRDVALKLIKAGLDTREVIARFESERQALALMNHANVARVLDAGATERGRPYFVMEFVKGAPITEHCDRHQLSIEERIELFMQVCDAVQHAHQKGIIHRDLKPRNILVEYEDGHAIPKIIDFGIAKATNQRLTEQTVFTRQGQFVGTPAYMSPEQADSSSQDIDTRSDVYSLGVLLYELLTGAVPLDAESLQQEGYLAMLRMIREHEPARPSTRLSSLSAADADVVRDLVKRRRTDLRSLARRLRGDLDWVVMKCLEKDRARRYGTASELAADLRRHLNNEPVTAGPPSAVYKLRKLVRRNRSLVGSLVVVFVVLIVGTVGTTVGMLRAIEAREAARIDARAAESMLMLLQDALSSVDPAVALGRDTTLMRDVLKSAEDQIGDQFSQRPLLAARLRRTLGQVYFAIGDYREASQHLAAALAVFREKHRAAHEELAATMQDLARASMEREAYAEADALLGEARGVFAEVCGEQGPEVAACLGDLGECYRRQGRLEEARAMLQAALAILEMQSERNELAIASVKRGLCGVHFDRHEHVEALRYIHEAVAVFDAWLGPAHSQTIVARHDLAAVLQAAREIDAAQEIYEDVLQTARRVFDADHPYLAWTCGQLGLLHLRDRKDPARAEPLLRERLSIQRRKLGNDHELTMQAAQGLAQALVHLMQYDEAAELYSEAIEYFRQQPDVNMSNLARMVHNLTIVLARNSQWEEACELAYEWVPMFRETLESNNWWFCAITADAGWHAYMQKRFAEAADLCCEASRCYQASRGATDANAIQNLENCAAMLERSNSLREAAELRAELVGLRRKCAPRSAPDVANALIAHANVLLKLDDAARAEPLLREAAALRQEHLPAGDKKAAAARAKLADCLSQLGRDDEAEAIREDLQEAEAAAEPAGAAASQPATP